MANVFIEENILQGWADTVREKTGTTDKMLPSALLQQTQDNWGTGGSDIQLIEGMEIPLDFSAGDQSLAAPDGQAVKSATIKKPTTLVPKNIANGVNIAGVVGTLESGGGESTDLVKYVTFLDEDGTQLYQMPVLVGDTCKDPVDHGDIAAPEKEDTNTIDYVHNGWTEASGGAADTDILKNITADKTVYAAFAANTRYYTVTFYDGETLLETVKVTYGGTALPTETPSKDDFMFNGWNPSNENITADTVCYAQWVETAAFADASWEAIARISESGMAQDTWALGDTKTVPFGNETLTLMIMGFNHDVDSEGNPIGVTIGFKDIPSTCKSRFGSSASSLSNYNSTELKSYLASTTFTNNLPSELVSVVKTARKKINGGYSLNKDTSVITTDVKFFPFTAEELGFDFTYYDSAWPKLGSMYPVFTSDNSSRIAYTAGTTTPVEYFTRQLVFSSSNYKPIYIKTTGTGTWDDAHGATKTFPVRVGFCI